MKSIIKHGKYYKCYFAVCEECDCQFDFSDDELSHTWDDHVICPECSNKIYSWSYIRQDMVYINKEENE